MQPDGLRLLATPVRGLDENYFSLADGAHLSPKPRIELGLTNTSTISYPYGSRGNEVAWQFAGFTGPGCGIGAVRRKRA